jgi:hypothetical protein
MWMDYRHGGATAPRHTFAGLTYIVWQKGGRKRAGRSEPKLLGDVSATTERNPGLWSLATAATYSRAKPSLGRRDGRVTYAACDARLAREGAQADRFNLRGELA